MRVAGRRITEHCGGDCRVAFLGYPGGCDIVGDVYYSQKFYNYSLWKTLKAKDAPAAIRAFLKDKDISHVVVVLDRFRHTQRDAILKVVEDVANRHFTIGQTRCYVLDKN